MKLMKSGWMNFYTNLEIWTHRVFNWLVFSLRHYIRDLSITGLVINCINLMNSFIEHKTNLIRKGLGHLRSIRRISNFIKQLYHVQTACYCSTASDFIDIFLFDVPLDGEFVCLFFSFSRKWMHYREEFNNFAKLLVDN